MACVAGSKLEECKEDWHPTGMLLQAYTLVELGSELTQSWESTTVKGLIGHVSYYQPGDPMLSVSILLQLAATA